MLPLPAQMLQQQGMEDGGPPAVGVGALLGIVAPLLQHMLVEGRAAEGHGHELKVPLMTSSAVPEECKTICAKPALTRLAAASGPRSGTVCVLLSYQHSCRCDTSAFLGPWNPYNFSRERYWILGAQNTTRLTPRCAATFLFQRLQISWSGGGACAVPAGPDSTSIQHLLGNQC